MSESASVVSDCLTQNFVKTFSRRFGQIDGLPCHGEDEKARGPIHSAITTGLDGVIPDVRLELLGPRSGQSMCRVVMNHLVPKSR